MKRSILLLIAACSIALLAACAIPPPSTGAPPITAATAASISDQAGKAIQEITLTRQALTQLAEAGKITWAQDDAGQAALSLIRTQLTQAQSLSVTNPAQAAQLLANALAALAAYQGAPK